MFWGHVVKEGKPMKSQQQLENSEFAALHISSAVLVNGQKDSKVTLSASNGKDLKNLTVASLSMQQDTRALDLYINCT